MSPPRNHGKSSGKPRCPKCGLHFKDLNGHVVRIHKTTLSILTRQVAQNVQDQDVQVQTRQDRRNERLYNKYHLIKKIDGYLRILRNKKLNAPKEDEFIFDVEIQCLLEKISHLENELKDVKNKLEMLKQKNNADLNDEDLYLNSQNLQMKTEIIQNDADIVNLTRKVAELNLANEKRIKLINDLEAQIVELTCEIGTLRDNFKMAEAESSQNARKELESLLDEREIDLSLLRNKIQELESLLGEREINLLKNRIQELESLLNI
ncbi:2246_t:CDS:2, partial [Gigaspora rosea]